MMRKALLSIGSLRGRRLWSVSVSLIIILFIERAWSAELLPHPDCAYQAVFQGSTLKCESLKWPSLFSSYVLSVIPLDIYSVFVSGFMYTNADTTSLPARDNLTKVVLHGKTGIAASVLEEFPIRSVFADSKRRIKVLELMHVKMSRLTKGDFNEFFRLDRLFLSNCCIRIMDVDVFSEMAYEPGREPLYNAKATLSSLYLWDNDIKHVDWLFLRPISESIQVIKQVQTDRCVYC